MLKTDDGYFAAQLTLDGVTYKIRDLTEGERKEWKAIGRKVLDNMRAVENLSIPDEQPTDEQIDEMTALTDALRDLRVEQVNFVVVAGLVKWSLKADLTRENVEALAPVIKAELASRIIRETEMSQTDADFLALQPKR